ncbi:YciI family protein [Caenimonas aquaedulcis]|uniref:YCII-related domain-containing protein n=1 Tax=Caenimonas aquaedulcis TaxID=2793270 RepID=A0A931H346_9BURK|nr:hypothetical protein [Caenimonas aquaedulcis]
MTSLSSLLATTALLLACAASQAQTAPPPPAAFDPELARSLGADERGMRSYVLVILQTGPNRVPAGPERDEMFKGHFANMGRLAKEGKLALAGPFDGADGWRGLFIFAVADVEEAKKLTATDPVIIKGEMVAQYHPYYGSAALMMVNQLHEKVVKKPF